MHSIYPPCLLQNIPMPVAVQLKYHTKAVKSGIQMVKTTNCSTYGELINILKPFPMISFVLPLSNEVVVPLKVHNTVDSIQRSHVNMPCT